ncbi:MAG TPA: Calx-beta domain-containing protein, partial [Pyrinomonadaceae bacterium]
SSGVSSATYNPTITYNISNNVINNNSANNASGTAIAVGKGGVSADASFVGTISGNTIGTPGVPNSGSAQGSAISVDIVGGGVHNSTITNNVIRQFTNFGIVAQSSSKNTGGGTGNLILDIRGNNIAQPSANSAATSFPTSGIRVVTGTSSGDDHKNCVTLSGNSIAGTGTNGGFDLRLFQRFLTTLSVSGYAGPNNDNAAMNAYLMANNTLTTVSATNNTGAGGPGYSGTCTAPLASLAPSNDGVVETAAVTSKASGFSADRALAAALDKTPRGFSNSERGQVLGAAGEFRARPSGVERPDVETPKAAPAVAPVAPVGGETVNVQIGTLRAGDSVTITFQVTVADPWAGAQPHVSNQATVTADGGISVLSDDPGEPGAADATVTPLLLPPTVNVNDATVAEPASGSANALFTVTLSHPFTQPVTVNYSTANGGANPADATDYTTTSGTVTFNAGQTVQTVSVPVLADGTAAEGDETFLVNLSGAANGTTGDGQANGTITDESIASPVIISELRTNGPNGSADDFVELLNTTDADIVVASTDGSGGWALVKRGADCSDTPVVVGVVPDGTVIPARGNYLFTGSGYSLAGYAAGNGTTATGDAALTADVENDGNVGLFTVANLANVSSVNRYDAVGFGAHTGGNCDLLREGNTLTPNPGFSVDYSFVRKVEKGQTVDTTDNAADFIVVDTNGTSIGGQQRLGAPGPENLSAPRGPVPCGAPAGSAKFGRDLIDPTVGAGVSPNVARDQTSDAANNSTFGTLDFRRTFTNNTGGAVTRLRFRVTNLSTFPAAAGTADLRARPSSNVVVTTAGGPKAVLGTTLEQTPSQPNGGGLNSTLSAGTVTLATPLAPGASVNLRFLFGVQQTGDYDIGVVLESLPGSGKDFWRVTGHTETGGHTDGGCNKPPVADAGADLTAECVSGQASVTLDGSGSTDPDGDTPLAYEWKEGATVLGSGQTLNVTLASGAHTITLKVTDPSGDSSQDTVAVNVVDTQAPVVNDPPDVTVYTGPGASSCGAVVGDATLGTATATDGCEGGLAVNRTGVPAGNFFPVGTTEVTYTATDAAGNVGTATQNVVVIDNTAPTVTPPANVVVNADAGSCSAMVNPGTATGSDNCAVQSVVGVRSDSQGLGAPYPVGTTTIAWTVTDASGNTASADQTVTVIDNQPPTITSAVAVTTMGPPHNHALINVGLSATASDNCGTVGPLQVFVYSDEDDGASPHSPDATNIGLGTLKLRRERDGGSNGRVYLIVVKATDASGNTSVSVTTVTVPLSNSAGDKASVNAQAAAAAASASANGGAPPAGYFEVGP